MEWVLVATYLMGSKLTIRVELLPRHEFSLRLVWLLSNPLFSHGQKSTGRTSKSGYYLRCSENSSVLVSLECWTRNEWYEAICVMVDRKELVWEAAPHNTWFVIMTLNGFHFPSVSLVLSLLLNQRAKSLTNYWV